MYVGVMEQKQEEAAREQAEHFESIPWSSLVPPRNEARRRMLFVAATVVIGVVLGLVGGGFLRGNSGRGTVVSLPPLAAAEPVADPAGESIAPLSLDLSPLDISVESPPPVDAAGVVAPVSPRLYSEADLMAVLPEEEMRAAVMRAEWFVTDFFTVDGSITAMADMAEVLPIGLTGTSLPHEDPGTSISYVEWARAYLVEPAHPGAYRVTVAFRTLAGPEPGALVRSAVRAVAVTVEVGADGASAVLDLPSPAERPPALKVDAAETAEMQAPTDVVAAAVAAGSGVGSDPAALMSGFDDDGWRVVVLIGDNSGLRWPLAVRP